MSSSILTGFNYTGSFGSSTKELNSDLTTNRFDSAILDSEWGHGNYEDEAGMRLNQLLENSHMLRTVKLDAMNPRQLLPADVRSLKEIDRIPNMFPYQLDITSEEDYKEQSQVSLVQDAFKNYANAQDALNPSRDITWDQKNSSDVRGERNRGKKASEVFTPDGSAAGKTSNHLDETGYVLNSIESTVAF